MKYLCLILVFALPFICVIPVHSAESNQAQSLQQEETTLGEWITNFIDNVVTEINDKLPDPEEFARQFKKYKEEIDTRLSSILDNMGNTIKDYAENSDDFLPAAHQLFQDFGDLSRKLWAKILEFPLMNEVSRIVKPVTDSYINDFKKNLPDVRHGGHGGNPLATQANFYEDMARENPYGIGPFFETELPGISERMNLVNEKIREETLHGFKQEDIIYKEVLEIENDEIVSSLLIINNNIINQFEKLKDLTIYHGMEREMEKDGGHESVVLLVNEFKNFINYNLGRACDKLDLIIGSAEKRIFKLCPNRYPRGIIRHVL